MYEEDHFWYHGAESAQQADPAAHGAGADVSGAAGVWTAEITAPAGITVTQPSTAGTANAVITATGAQASGVEITADYKAYVGTETAAGFYEGTITYALAAL